jgi:hypothetical protein
MIDIFNERVLALNEICELLPRNPKGGKVSFSTIWRWSKNGVIGPGGERVKLETVKIGGRLLSSEQAIQRFAENLSPPEALAMRPITLSQRRRNSEKASRELESMGI